MNIPRRRLIGGLAGFSVLGAPLLARTQQSSLCFLFVEADDCEPCKRWYANEGPAWNNVAEFGHVTRVFLGAPRVRQAYADANWPPHLRRFRDASTAPRATPAFLVLRDDQLVMTAVGLNAWRRQVYPVLRELVAASAGVYRAT